jgi:hypothetical protein
VTRRAAPSPNDVLEPILASDAALHLGHGEQSCPRDRLAALPTGAVFTRVKLGERCREMVHAGQQPLTRGETDLPALTGLDLVDLVGAAQGEVRASQLLDRHRSPQLAEAVDRRVQVVLEPLSDGIHGAPPG